MKIIDLEQNTPEWKAFRKTHIGASDVSCILGVNPHKTIFDLYKEKTEDIVNEENEDTQRGHDKEPKARINYVKKSGIELMPMVVESDEHSFISASLDGISEDYKIIYEAKCPRDDNYIKAINAEIPRHYVIQMQTQLLVTKAEKCIYNCYWSDDENFTKEVFPDKELHKFIVEKCIWFWDLVTNRKMDSGAAEKVASEWKALKLQQQENEMKLDELEGILKIHSQNQNMFFPNSNVEVTWLSRPGSISYSKVCKELNAPESLIEKYRGKSSFHGRVSISG